MCRDEARLSVGGSWGGGGVVISTLECLGGGNGGGVAAPSFSSVVVSSITFLLSISSRVVLSISSSTILLGGVARRLIIEDLFLAGRGGGFICPGVDGLDVDIVLLDPEGVLIGLDVDGDGIGGGVRSPGRIVDRGRLVAYINKTRK